jgi:hypothetical protein
MIRRPRKIPKHLKPPTSRTLTSENLNREKREDFSKKNHTRFFIELNRDIGALHHSFCGEHYDYMVPYYETGNPKYLKLKYTGKIIGKILSTSFLAGVILILPYILHEELDFSLLIPCAIFLVIVTYFKFNVLVGLLWKAKKKKKVSQGDEKDDKKDGTERKGVDWRVLRPDEVDMLAEKIELDLNDIYDYCGKNQEAWLSFKAKILEIQQKMLLYCAKSMRRIKSFELVYYRMLILFVPVYKSVLVVAAFLFYLYMFLFILIADTHSVPLHSLITVAEALLIAILISTIICAFQLILTPYFVENFKKQLSRFAAFADRAKGKIDEFNAM